jgi:LuxR family transcriptional regulator, maltose regulon positive regulatory protein
MGTRGRSSTPIVATTDPEIQRVFGLPIVPSRLVTPRLPPAFTPRPRVAATVSAGHGAICLVQAPAGYGKTTAIVEALAGADPKQVAWLSLDAYEWTELGFWAHLAASIDAVRPGFLHLLTSDLSDPATEGGIQLAERLLAALALDDELVIILDDLQHVNIRALWEQLAFFLERIPPGLRVVATTRVVTPLPVERWQAQGKATIIDQQTLRFDIAEATALICGVSQRALTAGEVAKLVDRSEGWAVGLLFEALAKDRTSSSSSQSSSGNCHRPTRTTINYLATEVLDVLSADDRQFLLQISILDEFDNDLCRRVTGEADAGMRLRSLKVANLFLVPVGDEPGRFRFHHLFRELLLEELDSRDPGRRIELHRRAAEAAGVNGEILVEIRHLLQAGDRATAFNIFIGHVLRQGVSSLAVARELIACFPNDVIEEDPGRMLEFALVLSSAGDWEMAEQWCDRVEATLTDDSGPLRARLELHRSWHYGGLGETESAEAALEKCIAAGGRADPSLGALAMTSMARLHIFLTRDRKAAAFWLDEARHHPTAFPLAHQVTIPVLTAFLRLWDGDLESAERLARRALTTADQLYIPLGLPSLEALLVLTDVLIETARVSEAGEVLERSEEVAGKVPPAYLVHIALRRIELAAATQGPAAGADAAVQERALLGKLHLGDDLKDALTRQHAYWLLEEGRTLEAARLAGTLSAGPSRSILFAKLNDLELHGHGTAVARILGDTQGWSASERLEAELICAAANGYQMLTDILDQADGFIWTVAKQGQPLLRRISSLPGDSTSAAARVLDGSTAFDPAFRPANLVGSGGQLTDREQVLLKMLSSHLSYAEMAAELFLSVNTVKANLKAVYRKLGASSRSEAVRRARPFEPTSSLGSEGPARADLGNRALN